MLSFLFRSARRVRKSRPPKPQAHTPIAQPAAPLSGESPKFNPKVQWWNNQEWLARYERHVLPDGFNGLHPHRILDRRFTLAELAKAARSLNGSTAECGVFKGIGSALICETLRDTYRDHERHFGFDSFEGLPETGPNDARWKRGDLSEPITAARQHLAEFSAVRLVPGWLPQTLEQVADHQFRLVHIDVDIERTTWDCLEFFYPRAVSGAVFVFDDYGFHSCPGARRAVDSFLSGKPETLIELTTGQATFFKR